MATKGLAHRLYRLCMLANVDRSPVIRGALDRMIAGTDTPPMVRAGHSYVEPKECKISLYLSRAQYRSVIHLAEERGVKGQDVMRAAVLLACERLERRMAGEPIGA
jgi:hypothetical protein